MTVPDGSLRRVLWRIGRLCRPLVEITGAPSDVTAEWDVPVVLSDGTTLRANVFRPASAEPVPVIMSAHPYGKDRIPANGRAGKGINVQFRMLPQPRPVRISAWTGWEAPDPVTWVRRGYAVVNADARGGGTSEGTGRMFSDQEAQDYAELIEWAACQPWSNGKVGLDGVSYLAISQYKVAALNPPHLAAICPWEGFTDLYRDFVYPGGIRETGFSILWAKMTQRGARLVPNLAGELAAHPERDTFYQDATPDLSAITAPMLVCGSFSDHNLHTRGSFELFRRAASKEKWLYTHRDGKWSHYYSAEATQTRAAFFDHYLRGVDNGWERRQAVRLAIYEHKSEPVVIRDEAAWPPSDLTWSTLYLTPTGLQDRVESRTTDSYRNNGVGLTYDWQLPADLDVIGPMALRLYLSTVGNDDPHVFVAVNRVRDQTVGTFEGSFGFDRDPVTVGWQRAAFRELDQDLSAPYRPVHTFTKTEPFGPGEIVPVDIELREQATRFRKGDILRLEIRAHWHFSRNPATGQFPSGYRSTKRGRTLIHMGPKHPSGLLLGHRPAHA
jgi:predicted acyl esterase